MEEATTDFWFTFFPGTEHRVQSSFPAPQSHAASAEAQQCSSPVPIHTLLALGEHPYHRNSEGVVCDLQRNSL